MCVLRFGMRFAVRCTGPANECVRETPDPIYRLSQDQPSSTCASSSHITFCWLSLHSVNIPLSFVLPTSHTLWKIPAVQSLSGPLLCNAASGVCTCSSLPESTGRRTRRDVVPPQGTRLPAQGNRHVFADMDLMDDAWLSYAQPGQTYVQALSSNRPRNHMHAVPTSAPSRALSTFLSHVRPPGARWL